MNINRTYGNERVYAPGGKLLFLTTVKRTKWYLDRNLADKVSDGIILNFEPNGNQYDGDNYHLSTKENRCVVCGVNELSLLTKHHIIPTVYRKHFPIEAKSRNSHDVVIICTTCHREYEIDAAKFKEQLSIEYDVPNHNEFMNEKREYAVNEKRIMCIANTLLTKSDKLPYDKKISLEIQLEMLSGLNLVDVGLEFFIKSKKHLKEIDKMNDEQGLKLIEKVKDLQEFAERWRQHFLDIAEPQFMPIGWKVNRPIIPKN